MGYSQLVTATYISAQQIRDSFYKIFSFLKVNKEIASYVVEGLLQTSLRGVDSHGIRLFPHYIQALKGGRINGHPQFKLDQTASSTAKLDADHTYGHAAGAKAIEQAIHMAQKTGVGAVSVYNSSHFGAASYFGLMAAEKDMIGLSFTHADSLMLSTNSTRAFFGTNPICFTAPVEGETPFCLDMATTTITWNKVKIHRENTIALEYGVGADAKGNITTDPQKAVSLLPIGDYKGFGLGMVVDILCGLLSGMPFGREISNMYQAPLHEKRYLGHFFIAMDISKFIGIEDFKKRLKIQMDLIRSEPARDLQKPVLVPGDPEKRNYATRIKEGIPLGDAEYKKLKELCETYSISL